MTTKREVLIAKLKSGEPLTSDERLAVIGYLEIRAGHNLPSWRTEQAARDADAWSTPHSGWIRRSPPIQRNRWAHGKRGRGLLPRARCGRPRRRIRV